MAEEQLAPDKVKTEKSEPFAPPVDELPTSSELQSTRSPRLSVIEKNREYAREYNQRPYVKSRKRKFDKAYRRDPINKAKIKEYKRAFYQKNKDKLREKQQIYRRRPEVKARYSKQKCEYYRRPEIRERTLKRVRLYSQRPEVKKRIKSYQQQHRNEYREQERNIRRMVIEYLGGKCVNCGCSELEALEINHKWGGGRKEYRHKWVGKRYYRAILTGKREKNDLEITCRVCNALHYLKEIRHLKGNWSVECKERNEGCEIDGI